MKWRETGSTNPNDYPLACQLAVFSEQARDAFLRLPPEGREGSILTEKERQRVSELAGICAWETPEAAWKCGADPNAPYPSLFVEFEGEFICPDPGHQGVIARVIRPTAGPMSAAAFKAKHNL